MDAIDTWLSISFSRNPLFAIPKSSKNDMIIDILLHSDKNNDKDDDDGGGDGDGGGGNSSDEHPYACIYIQIHEMKCTGTHFAIHLIEFTLYKYIQSDRFDIKKR